LILRLLEGKPTLLQSSDEYELYFFDDDGVHQILRSQFKHLYVFDEPEVWLLIDGAPMDGVICYDNGRNPDFFVVQTTEPCRKRKNLIMFGIYLDAWSWPEICAGM
jgi:hypothetical protein